MNKLLLKLVMLPQGLYGRMGADVAQLRALLEVKLKMDDRKPISTLNMGAKKKKPARFTSFWTAFISFFTGIIYILPMLALREEPVLGLWAYFTFFLFLLSFTLITDFSNVLLDTRDKYVVMPRPVNNQTLFLSRLLHICIYLIRIVVPMSLPGWIVMGLINWKLAIWFPLPLFLLVGASLFLVMLLYLLMLRLASPERFKNILNGFQIALSILLFSSYYLVPQVMESAQVAALKLADVAWVKIFPTFWIAATGSWLLKSGAVAGAVWYSLLAVLFPALLLWVAVRWLAPGFMSRLADAETGGEVQQTARPQTQRSSHSWAQRLNKSTEARAGFSMAWIQTGRSRSFKMKVLPTFAYVPVYFFYLLFINKHASFQEVWTDLPHTARHIGLLYMAAFILLQTLNYLVMSDQYKAAWVYFAAPLARPGMVMAGAFKAVWIKYFLPFFVAIAAFVLYVWGLGALWDVALALVNVTVFAVGISVLMYRYLPFSKVEQMKEKGGRFFKMLLVFIIPAMLGIGHYLAWLADFWWLKLIYLLLSLALLWTFWDSYRNTTWAQLKTEAA